MVKNQHYIPRTYLKRWFTDFDRKEQAYLFDITKQKMQMRSDCNKILFACEEYFYEVNKAEPNNYLENYFSSGENALGVFFENLYANSKNFKIFDMKTKTSDLINGITSLNIRTKYQLEELDKIIKNRKSVLNLIETTIARLNRNIYSNIITIYDFSNLKSNKSCLYTCDSPYLDFRLMRSCLINEAFQKNINLIPSGRLPCGPKCFIDLYHNDHTNFKNQLLEGGRTLFISKDNSLIIQKIEISDRSCVENINYINEMIQITNNLIGLRARKWVLYSPEDFENKLIAKDVFDTELIIERIKSDRIIKVE